MVILYELKKKGGLHSDLYFDNLQHYPINQFGTFALTDIQDAFDKDREAGNIIEDRWYNNASAEGILGYKLLVQTGDIDSPEDKSRVGVRNVLSQNRGVVKKKRSYSLLQE